MPIYTYKHPLTGKIYEDIRPFSRIDEKFIAEDGVECPRLKCWENIGELGIIDKNAEVWEKDNGEYCRHLNPRTVKTRSGKIIPYNPNTMF